MIGKSKLWQLIQSGEIRSCKIGRCRRIPVEAIDEFIARELADQAEANNVQSDLFPATSGDEKVQ
jgi:excisionase family DNA binding protein